MRTIFKITALLIMSLGGPLPAPCEVMDRIVAIVNDDIITLKESEKHVRVEKSDRFVSVNEYLTNMKLKEKMDLFIDDVLIRQQAKKLKIEVSDKEVESIVEGIKKQYLISDAELREQLKKDNVTYEDFLIGIRTNVLKNRVLARVISPEMTVTEKDLRDYYERHKSEYVDEEYRLQQVFISGQRPDAQKRALDAHKRLQQGTPFESVVKEFSDDAAGAGHGGDIGFVRRGELIPQLRAAVELLQPATYSNVIATPYGLHILKLIERKQGDLMTFETAKDSIHQRIVQEESEKRYKDYITKLRQTSYIEVKI